MYDFIQHQYDDDKKIIAPSIFGQDIKIADHLFIRSCPSFAKGIL